MAVVAGRKSGEGATALPGGQVALVAESPVGGGHCVARDAERLGKRALRGEAGLERKTTVEDEVAHTSKRGAR